MSSLFSIPFQSSRKSSVFFTLTFLLLSNSLAESVYQIPLVPEIQRLEIWNTSSQSVEAWINDENVGLEAFEHKSWNHEQLLNFSPNFSSLRLLAQTNAIGVRVWTKNKKFYVPIESHAAFEPKALGDFYIINTTHEKSRWFLNSIEQTALEPREARMIHSSLMEISEVRSAKRVQVFSITKGFAQGKLDTGLSLDLEPKPKYKFLVSNLDRSSSYIVWTNDTALAEEARNVISSGVYKLVFAKIRSAEAWKKNIDYYHPTRAPWSWESGEYIGLGDFGSQACDGNPQLIEERLPYYLLNQPIICFWSYHLERELTP